MRLFLCAAAMTAALLASASQPARADDATLTARGGTLSVSGRLVAYDGSVYRIDTTWGRLTVDAAAVDCAGPGCPDLMRFAPEWRIAAEPWLADRVLAPLFRAFSAAEGLDLTTADAEGIELSHGGQPVLRIRLVPLTAGPDAALTTGLADTALAVPAAGAPAGPLLARLPLMLATGPTAPPGPISLDALRTARQSGDASWAGIGDAVRPLVWHGMAPGGALDRATDAMLGPAGPGAALTGTDPEQIAAALRRDPWGLSLLPAPLPPGLVAPAVVTSCGLIPDQSDFAAAAGNNPLTLALHWQVGPARIPALARDLMAWSAGPAGQRALGAAGLHAPSATLRRPLNQQGQRLANALTAADSPAALTALRDGVTRLAGASALAISLRHDRRSGALDTAGRSALAEVAAQLATGAMAGHELLVIGLTDSQSPASDGLARARAVMALLAASPDRPEDVPLTALGLGAILPLACDDTPEGRALNRRVEIWLRPIR